LYPSICVRGSEKFVDNHFYTYLGSNKLFLIAFLNFADIIPHFLTYWKLITFLVTKNSGCSSRFVFVDISKRFDEVIHSVLFKLGQFGVTGSLLHFIQSYTS